MEKNTTVNLPKWMKLDTRPMDIGRFGKYGYGYTRPVGKRELWRPASRYFKFNSGKFGGIKEITLKPNTYFVSDHGRIYSTASGLLKKSKKHRRKLTRLYDSEGKFVYVRPYRLCLDNWLEPPKCHRSVVRHLLRTCNHKNGKYWDDRLDNIEYASRAANTQHEFEVLNMGERRKNSKQSGKKRSKK